MEKQVEEYLYTHIPISKALGIKVEEARQDKVVLWAPFENNINHKKTVFGGSLHAVCTLACWSLLHLNLQGKHAQIVITKSDVEYLAPVSEDFQAVCEMPDQSVWQRFMKLLEAKGKGRLELHANVHQNERLCVRYKAMFAALC